jgi:hypothetical protein
MIIITHSLYFIDFPDLDSQQYELKNKAILYLGINKALFPLNELTFYYYYFYFYCYFLFFFSKISKARSCRSVTKFQINF